MWRDVAIGSSPRGLHRLGWHVALTAMRQACNALPQSAAEHAKMRVRAKACRALRARSGRPASYPALMNGTAEPYEVAIDAAAQ